MESTSIMALLLAGSSETATSALPHAPRLAEDAHRSDAWAALRGRTANILHRLAWAVEPFSHRNH
jgi:hypothetical protein